MTGRHSDEVMGWVYPICLVAMFATPAIWIYQLAYWLRYGEWDAIPVSEGLQWIGLAAPRFTWEGVQRISDWLMTLPLSISLFFLILGVMTLISEWADRRERASERAPSG